MSLLEWLVHGTIPVPGGELGAREVIGNLFGLASAILGMKRFVWAWPVGLVGNVLLFTVFATGELSGHIVQGHVDGVGEVISRSPSEHWDLVEISLPDHLARYLVDKGSITVDGVSLTVVEARPTSFTVSLIPETLARTTLGHRQVGDRVNLETDVIAKHVAKLVAAYLPQVQESKEQQS